MTIRGKLSCVFFVMLGMVAAMAPIAAVAQQVPQTKEACKRLLADVVEMRSVSDSGPRANAEVDDLVQVTRHLCDQGNFVYAAKLMSIARGLLATE